MTPAARVQTAIELLDRIVEAARAKAAPADRILAEWFRSNRFAGSKDRRAIRELVYAAIRACGPVPATGRAAMLPVLRKAPDPLAVGRVCRAAHDARAAAAAQCWLWRRRGSFYKL